MKKDIYLVGFYFLRPRPGVNTSKSGWMEDANNVFYDEKIEITRGQKKNAGSAKVILNLSKKTIDKNSWGTERTFTEYFKYYFKGYHEYITQVMTELDIEYLNQILDELQAEIDAKNPQEVPKDAEIQTV